jgi:GrpB-like predicted nucleotidyltransferase (UPF0157 family)
VFEAHHQGIPDILGSKARKIEHLGSTAVQRRTAKPIVDIMVTVDDPEDESHLRLVEPAGYVLRVRELNHRMFHTPERDVQVHIWQAAPTTRIDTSSFAITFDPTGADREAYEALKRSLAGR